MSSLQEDKSQDDHARQLVTGEDMKTTQEIEARLRWLAAKFDGRAMGHRLLPADHGAARDLQVSFLNDDGVACEVADELLSIADDVYQLTALRVKQS